MSPEKPSDDHPVVKEKKQVRFPTLNHQLSLAAMFVVQAERALLGCRSRLTIEMVLISAKGGSALMISCGIWDGDCESRACVCVIVTGFRTGSALGQLIAGDFLLLARFRQYWGRVRETAFFCGCRLFVLVASD